MIRIYQTSDGYTFHFAGKDAECAMENIGAVTYHMHNTSLDADDFERIVKAISPKAHIEVIRDRRVLPRNTH